MSLRSVLSGPLKWLASLGTGAVSSLLFWLLTLVGITQGKSNPLLLGFMVAVVAKVVGWLVAEYGPSPPPPSLSTRRKRSNGGSKPNGPPASASGSGDVPRPAV